MPQTYNIASALPEMAKRAPYQPGVVFPAGRDHRGRAKSIVYSFQQLNEECDRYAHGLHELGIRQGDRVLLLFHPGVELMAVVFALVKMGAVPVLIDPGMGRRAFLRCVADTEARALIGLPIAHMLRRIVPKPFDGVRHTVVVGGTRSVQRLLAETSLQRVRSSRRTPYPIAPTTTESEAAIAFTSGSTGIPKGVIYEHGMFKAQIALLRDEIGMQPGEVDLALLYVFALFNPALGVTTIIPDMDPTKSAEINPAYVVEAVQTYGVTNAFGSPTIWKRVAPYCRAHGIRLPSIKRILMAGAPVPPELIGTMLDHVLSPSADVLTPFGATEAMPLTSIGGQEIVQETAALTQMGKGMCVGTPLPGITVRIIGITDDPIPDWDPNRVLDPGEIGEIVVKGPMVTRTYLNRPEQTALAKIREGSETWHRMGDLGYFDERGRLWFCGRKSHRVETAQGTLFPVLCETIFNEHPDVHRTAVVGVGPHNDQEPILVVEPYESKMPQTLLEQQRLTMELLALGTEFDHTRSIKRVLIYPDVFPTDIRHNAKIQREKLAIWAATQIRQPSDGPKRTVRRRGDSDVSYTGEPRPGRRLESALRLVGLLIGVLVSLWLLISQHEKSENASSAQSK
ncbi:MAG: fatty acid CoA ligase family protein [Anaerolineae bacterium]